MRQLIGWIFFCTVAASGCGAADEPTSTTSSATPSASTDDEQLQGAYEACQLVLATPQPPPESGTPGEAMTRIERYGVALGRTAEAARRIPGDGAARVAELADNFSRAALDLATMGGDPSSPEVEFRAGIATGAADRLDAFCVSANDEH